MNFRNAVFTASYAAPEALPASLRPEVSFAGRSNVGKSSLLNALFSRKNLVKVSQTPGKTTTINFFSVDVGAGGKGGADFVDLPGYGFAKVSQTERNLWAALMEGYFTQERNHALVVCLVDIRHEAQPLDCQMIAYVRALDLPFCVVFTKGDKLSRAQIIRQTALLRAQLDLADADRVFTTSATTGAGIEPLRSFIAQACTAARAQDVS